MHSPDAYAAAGMTLSIAVIGWFITGERERRSKRLLEYASWVAAADALRQCIKRVGLNEVGTREHENEMDMWFRLWDRYKGQTYLVRLVASPEVLDHVECFDQQIRSLSRSAREQRLGHAAIWQNVSPGDVPVPAWRSVVELSEDQLNAALKAMRAEGLRSRTRGLLIRLKECKRRG